MDKLLSQVQLILRDPTIKYQRLVLMLNIFVGIFEKWIGSRQLPYLNPLIHSTIPISLLPHLRNNLQDKNSTFLKSQLYANDTLRYKNTVSLSLLVTNE